MNEHRDVMELNAALVGEAKARNRLLTPALLVDLPVLEANLLKMQRLCDEAGVRLRPHAKAHKCPAIAKRQLALGAVGICVATLGEAQCFAEAGITDILCTSTFATEQACARAVALLAQGITLTCVVDHPDVVSRLDALSRQAGVVMPVLIDVDMGRHRSGVASVEAGVALAQAIVEAPGLRLVGLQGYAGHLSHCWEAEARARGAEEAGRTLAAMQACIERHCKVRLSWITGGSTGAFLQEKNGPYTELQCGSYALMDTEYAAVDPDGSGQPLFPASLFLATSVISANHPEFVTTDGGEKRLASKYGMAPRITSGAASGAQYRAISDEHGQISGLSGQALTLGARVELEVPHCDPTVNLFDQLHVVSGEDLLAIWPISARGR